MPLGKSPKRIMEVTSEENLARAGNDGGTHSPSELERVVKRQNVGSPLDQATVDSSKPGYIASTAIESLTRNLFPDKSVRPYFADGRVFTDRPNLANLGVEGYVYVKEKIAEKLRTGLEKLESAKGDYDPAIYQEMRKSYVKAQKLYSDYLDDEMARSAYNVFVGMRTNPVQCREILSRGIQKLMDENDPFVSVACKEVISSQWGASIHESPEVQQWLASQLNEGGHDNQLDRSSHESPEVQEWFARQSNEGGRENQLDRSSHQSSEALAEYLEGFESDYNKYGKQQYGTQTPLYNATRAIEAYVLSLQKASGDDLQEKEQISKNIKEMQDLKDNMRKLNNSFGKVLEKQLKPEEQLDLVGKIAQGLKDIPEDVLRSTERLANIYKRFWSLDFQVEEFNLQEDEDKKKKRLKRALEMLKQNKEQKGGSFLNKLEKAYDNRYNRSNDMNKNIKNEIRDIRTLVNKLSNELDYEILEELDEKARNIENKWRKNINVGKSRKRINFIPPFLDLLMHGKALPENLNTGEVEPAEDD